MRRLAPLVLLAHASIAFAQPTAIRLLPSTQRSDFDGEAAVEAVTIYTRDLHLDVRLGPPAPTAITGETLGQVAAMVRAESLRMAFWYEEHPPDADGVLYAITSDADRIETHALRVGHAPPPELYRAIALKVRAILTGTAHLEPQLPTPTLPKSPAPPSPPVAAPLPSPSRPAPYRPRALLSVAYRLTIPLDTSLLRHGVLVEGALPLRRWLELALAIDVMTQPGVLRDEVQASLFDVPIRLAARGLLRSGRFIFGLGPMVAVHVLGASATGADGTHAESKTAAAGLGGELFGRVQWSDHLAVELRLLGEGLVPNTRFLLRGTPAIETGAALFGVSLGLTCGLP